MSNQPNTQFRPSMTWVHTWSGVILGALMFTVFWMGSLSVFNHEIDRWMQPQTRLAFTPSRYYVDEQIAKIQLEFPNKTINEASFGIPQKRLPFAWDYYQFADGNQKYRLRHPITNEAIATPTSAAATGFLFPMHFRLFLPGITGWWIVLIVSITLLLLLTTGVIIHRKIFKDFFTFRANKKFRRANLDLHNLTGTLFLPFHFMITLSGLMIFSGWYTSFLWDALPGQGAKNVDELLHIADDYGYYSRPAAGVSVNSVDINPLIDRAQKLWQERYGVPIAADYVGVKHWGDANGYVTVMRKYPKNRVYKGLDSVVFALTTGEIIVDYQPTTLRKTQRWLSGLHFIQFDHWALRWLYFISGLVGCVMIATGLLYFTASRRNKYSGTPFYVRLIETVSIGSVTGLITATGVFLVVNRVLDLAPSGATTVMGIRLGALEIIAFFTVWIGSYCHAALRTTRAWQEQLLAIAVLAVSAVLLNWITTGDHPIAAATQQIWSVVWMDIALMAIAAIAIFAAKAVKRHRSLGSNANINFEPSAANRRHKPIT